MFNFRCNLGGSTYDFLFFQKRTINGVKEVDFLNFYKNIKATGLAHATLTGRGALLTAGCAKNILTGEGATVVSNLAAGSYTTSMAIGTGIQTISDFKNCNCIRVPNYDTNNIIVGGMISGTVGAAYTGSMYTNLGVQSRKLPGQAIDEALDKPTKIAIKKINTAISVPAGMVGKDIIFSESDK